MKKEFVRKEEKKEKVQNCENLSWKFWHRVNDVCDEKMEMVMERMEGMQDVEKCWSMLKEGILEVMECGRTRAKRIDDEEGEVNEMKNELERLKKESTRDSRC